MVDIFLFFDGIPVLHGMYYFVHWSTINKGAKKKIKKRRGVKERTCVIRVLSPCNAKLRVRLRFGT